MKLQWKKSPHADRPHTLTVTRDDGTTVGQATTDFFVRHDLTHYAVESQLQLERAFFGLLNEGWDFDSFSEREPGSVKSRALPFDAGLAEALVGSFDLERVTGPLPDEARMHDLQSLYPAGTLFPHLLCPATLDRIRTELHRLLAKWDALGPGEAMVLALPPEESVSR